MMYWIYATGDSVHWNYVRHDAENINLLGDYHGNGKARVMA